MNLKEPLKDWGVTSSVIRESKSNINVNNQFWLILNPLVNGKQCPLNHTIMTESQGSWLDKAQLYANTCNHMLIAIVAFYTTSLCLRIGPTNYSWHMWLCMIGVS